MNRIRTTLAATLALSLSAVAVPAVFADTFAGFDDLFATRVATAEPAPSHTATPQAAPVEEAAPASAPVEEVPVPAPLEEATPAPAPVEEPAPAPVEEPAPAPAPVASRAPAPAPVPVVEAAPADAAAAARQAILAETNAARAAAGLSALTASSALDGIAQACSNTQAANGVMAHCGDYYSLYPAGWTRAAENVAYGQSIDGVVDAWLASPGHRANILDPSLTHIGIGYALGADGRPYYTQDFGAYPNGL